MRGRSAPQDDVQSTGLTNLLFGVPAPQTDTASDLSTPKVLFRSLPHAGARHIHAISFSVLCPECLGAPKQRAALLPSEPKCILGGAGEEEQQQVCEEASGRDRESRAEAKRRTQGLSDAGDRDRRAGMVKRKRARESMISRVKAGSEERTRQETKCMNPRVGRSKPG